MRTAGEQDAAVLQETLPMPALGAAHDLRTAAEQVARRDLAKAQARRRITLFGFGQVQLDVERAEAVGDDTVHADKPRFARLPRLAGRERDRVRNFEMMSEILSAAWPAHERQVGEQRIGQA